MDCVFGMLVIEGVFWVQYLGFRVQGLAYRVRDLGLLVWLSADNLCT